MPRPPSRYGRASSRTGVVNIQVDTQGLEDFARKVKADLPKAGVLIRRGNRAMASQLQGQIVTELRNAIAARARVQREDQQLIKALENQRFIAVDTRGFSLGNIAQINPQVAKYYVGLEVGSKKFVGRKIMGMFATNFEGSPEFVRFNKEGGDRTDPRFVQFRQRIGPPPQMGFHDPRRLKPGRGRPKKHYHRPFIKIEHAIQGYHYFAAGTAAFRKSGGALMKVQYAKAFGSANENFFAAWASGGLVGRGPRASATSSIFTRPKIPKGLK